jgi:N-acetylglutamate synthase-like GNAT family acetyltransferase
METRFATEDDIPAIIDLLKTGLGEALVPKSESYWRWKHLENPFGDSLVLLAVKKETIIGVRTFMRWQWKVGAEPIEAVRGVDTVIHPDHQGNGIFGELTMELMKKCEERGYHILFSTPNERSKRGYLKLGWERPDHLPVNIKVIRPFRMLTNVLGKSKPIEPSRGVHDSIAYYLSRPDLDTLLVMNEKHYPSKIITAHTRQSLQWRYADVPVGRYYAIGVEEHGTKALCFYRLKSTSAGTEMRITDIFLESALFEKNLKRVLLKKIAEHDVDFVTSGSFNVADLVSGALALSRKSIGPCVTTHKISLPDLNNFGGFANWSPSLGDLELF